MLMSSGGRTRRQTLGLELSPEMNSQFVPLEFGGLIRKGKEGSAAAETPAAMPDATSRSFQLP